MRRRQVQMPSSGPVLQSSGLSRRCSWWRSGGISDNESVDDQADEQIDENFFDAVRAKTATTGNGCRKQEDGRNQRLLLG
jgi:hypothetical protein